MALVRVLHNQSLQGYFVDTNDITGFLTSFNGRVAPAVIPAVSDYSASQVTNDSIVAGAFVSNALNTLNTALSDTQAWNPTQGQPGWAIPQWNAAVMSQGIGSITEITGTAVANGTDTNYLTRRARRTYNTTAVAGVASVIVIQSGGPGGSFSRNSGFRWTGTIGLPSTIPLSTNGRWFLGVTATNTYTNDPTVHVNMIGIGRNVAGGNVQLWTNDNAGTATAIDLGPSFPSGSIDAVYNLTLICAPGGASVTYQVRRLDTPVSVSGTLTADLPVASAFPWSACFVNNNADAATSGVQFLGINQIVPFV
jgi:hypothetical protein